MLLERDRGHHAPVVRRIRRDDNVGLFGALADNLSLRNHRLAPLASTKSIRS